MTAISGKEEQPAYITRLLAHCHTRKYPAKKDIIRPGDPADVLSYLMEGSMTVLLDEEDGRELILTYLNKGDYIGEVGIFLPSPTRSARVRTRTECRIAEISYSKLHNLLNNELKDCATDILRSLSTQIALRLVQTSRKVSQLAMYDVAGRIARTLLDLCKEPDAITHPDGMLVRITRQDLGRLVGCSREMAGRVLKRMEDEGLIAVSGKSIVVFGTR